MPYAEGDLLELREWEPGQNQYTGRRMRVAVTFLQPLGNLDPQLQGWVSMEVLVLDYWHIKPNAVATDGT